MRTSRLRVATLAVLALALPLAACGSDDDSSSDTAAGSAAPADSTAPAGSAAGGEVPDGPTITIGAQDFGESAILSQVYGQALEAAGYPVEQQAVGGFRDILFAAFESGDVNFSAEYAASALEFLNGGAGEATSDAAETVALLQTQLEPKGLLALTPSPAVDSNSFVVTAEKAEELGLANVSDLTADMTLGGPPDCPENASCIPGLQSVYDLDLSANFVPLDGGGPLTVAALEEGEIDVAILFSTDGTIADKGWVVLTDDKGLVNADNITPVLSQELIDTYGADVQALVDSISAAMTTAGLTELNRRVGIELEDADAVATDWLTENGFLG
jgi:osmoprotectant transport system substrate-binding protein